MTKTLEVLSEKKFKGVKLGLGDEGDFNANMHSMEEEDWIRAVGERPKSIVLHILLADDMVSEKDTDEVTEQIHMAFPHAKVETNQELKDDPTQPEKRLLWACDMTRHLELQFFIRYVLSLCIFCCS